MPFGAERSGMLGQQENQRLVDKLARQREQDLQHKKAETDLFEQMVREGHYPNITQDEIDNRMYDIWKGHSGNKKLIDEHSEKAHGIHKVFDALGHLFKAPPEQPYTPYPSTIGLSPVFKPTTKTPTTVAPAATQTSVSFGPAAERMLGAPNWLQSPGISRQYDRYAVNDQTGHRMGYSGGKWYDATTGEEITQGGM